MDSVMQAANFQAYVQNSSRKLKCAVCLNFAQNAFEASCCGQVFCSHCTNRADQWCGLCQVYRRFYPSRAVRGIIEMMPVICRYACGVNGLTRATVSAHEEVCPRKVFVCSLHGCMFSGILQDFANHMAEQHPRSVVARFAQGQGQGQSQGLGVVAVPQPANRRFLCPMNECVNRGLLTRNGLVQHLDAKHYSTDCVYQYQPPVVPQYCAAIMQNSEYDNDSSSSDSDY